jgi:hypothetical protein
VISPAARRRPADALTHALARGALERHRIAPLPRLTANIRLHRGDNRALSLWSFLLLLLTFACLWTLLPADVRGSPVSALGFGWPLAALLATPVAAHCWVLGFSGNQWYAANLSAVAAIACFAVADPVPGDGCRRLS